MSETLFGKIIKGEIPADKVFEDDDVLFYAVAVAPKLQSKLGAFIEIFGTDLGGSNTIASDFGISYSHSPRFVSDISFAFGLNDRADDWLLQIGFTAVLFKVF